MIKKRQKDGNQQREKCNTATILLYKKTTFEVKLYKKKTNKIFNSLQELLFKAKCIGQNKNGYIPELLSEGQANSLRSFA